MKVAFHPAAVADLNDAVAWYDRQRRGLGNTLRAEVDVAIDRIAANPISYREPIVPPERFIDGYRSRNERLASLMRRGICEEKSSGIDKVVRTAEVYQLPAPDFRATHERTSVVIFGPRGFDEMDKDDRIRACYQHCALRWVTEERMTNQSLRERFRPSQSKSAIVSQIIAATIAAGLVKADETAGDSRKYARYLPFWA